MADIYHVSEEPGIEWFEPRPTPYVDDPVVWAVGEHRLHNYLLPRDCPRVTCFASPENDSPEMDRILMGSHALVAIEHAWLQRVRDCRLYLYRMPPQTFEQLDGTAGYVVSREAVAPTSVEVVDDCLAAIAAHGVEFRVVSNLWPLRDAILAATQNFSFIRMRNAQPKQAAQVDKL